MAKFPEPPTPETLALVEADVKSIKAGALFWRIYFQGGRHPARWNDFRHFGPTLGRFDPHVPPPRVQARAVFYAAGHGPTCLAEVFQETRLIDRTGQGPWLVAFKLKRAVELLDLTGTWPTRAGTSTAIASGSRLRAQRWSRAIYAAYPRLQGVYYGSSMYASQPAVALFERALGAVPKDPVFHRPLADPILVDMLKNAAKDLGYGLI